MATAAEAAQGGTFAETLGMTAEIGRGIARLASDEIRAGRLDAASEILQGLALANPKDAVTWALLAQLERRRGRVGSAYFCAEVAAGLAPADEQVRLARAEVLLAMPERAAEGRQELVPLSGAAGDVGERARQLLAALGS